MSADLVSFDEKFLPELREIFFESSTRKDFADEAEREKFFYKYVGFYLRHYPALVILAVAEKKLVGYVLGAPSSLQEELLAIQPHLAVFKADFKRFPAHLHINLHPASRGQGLGGKLVAAFEEKLKNQGIFGLHIMTGPDALNKTFYSRLGFYYENKQSFQGNGILLMGKALSDN